VTEILGSGSVSSILGSVIRSHLRAVQGGAHHEHNVRLDQDSPPATRLTQSRRFAVVKSSRVKQKNLLILTSCKSEELIPLENSHVPF
jgi:hypothetical protein